jgi:hypothetical protein
VRSQDIYKGAEEVWGCGDLKGSGGTEICEMVANGRGDRIGTEKNRREPRV